jgi:lipoprotein-anchoring transpeptidase ErfK/SrfK
MVFVSSYRLFTIALACIAAIAVRGASAQNCDGLFPWLCPGVFDPPRSTQPQVPSAPLRILPDDLDEPAEQAAPEPPNEMRETVNPAVRSQYAGLYAAVNDDRFPIPAVRLSDINPSFFRKTVYYPTYEHPSTIVIDPQNHFLYFIEGGGRAIRYGVGVGRQGFGWSGAATVHDKQKWPDWYPPKEMIQRQPRLMEHLTELQGGLGMPGGPRNPLGSRAMYLWQGNKDTLFRIHGTNEPWTIGKSVSSGCIRMINQDVIDLYERTSVGTRVVVLSPRRPYE